MYSRRLEHFGAGTFFLVLAMLELIEARTGPVSYPLSVSMLAGTASYAIILGAIVLAWKVLFRLRLLVPMFLIAVVAVIGSGLYWTGAQYGYCSFSTESSGFPYPWRSRFVFSGDHVCPLPALYLPILGGAGPSMTVFLADVIFYVALGLSMLQFAYWVREVRRRDGSRTKQQPSEHD